jgi:hypothetical protein
MRMNKETKSIAYAFVANGVQIYLGDEDDLFITSKLICSNCGGPWYMNLTECFLCGSLNEFLYRCQDCGEFISITNSSGKCNNCGSENLYMVCPNPECISNKDETLLNEINRYGGVFNKKSGFLISQQYCLYCGSQSHKYKSYTIRVITTNSDFVSLEGVSRDTSKNVNNSYLIVRRKKNGEISYGVYKVSETNGISIGLKDLYDDFSKVVEFLYPTKKQDDYDSRITNNY